MSKDEATSVRSSWRDDFTGPGVWIVTALVAVLHLAVAARYDFFRNELYFIICGRHPAFGYVDQPPLVPLLAAATQVFGNNLFLLRLPAVLAATALVPVTAALARTLGGDARAALVAAIAAAIAPGLGAITSNLGTATFEPLGWTLCAYFLLRATEHDDLGALLWAGLVAGLSLEAKYGIAVWLVGLSAGAIVAGRARILGTRNFWLAVFITVAIGGPSLVWQAAEGWPFLAIIAHHNEEGAYFNGSPLRFFFTQTLAMNILLAPLWLGGLIAPFAMKNLKPARILATAFVVSAVAIFLAHGKDYYLFPAFPPLFAAGGVAAERLNRWLRGVWLVLAVANSALIAPLMLPILPPPALERMIKRIGAPKPNEAAGIGAKITQVFSDEFAWRDLEAKTASVYRGLTAADRANTAIFASNYGEAAAIDFFGRADGLPTASSGQNQYFLWGPQKANPSVLIVINGDPPRWQSLCRSLTQAATFGAPYAMPYEDNRPIFLCRGLRSPLARIWPELKRFQ